MGTKLLRFKQSDRTYWGVFSEQIRIVEHEAETLHDLLSNGREAIERAKHTGTIIYTDEITILSPVTDDANIFCQGTNYSVHREEAGFTKQKPPYNLLFTKASSTLTSAAADIICPTHVQLLDYEIELGLIIKTDITEPIQITENNLVHYIAGIVIANDISARDVQILEQQWFKGKSYRGFCPVGPYIYLLDEDEFPYLNQLELHLQINGETRQRVLTDQLLFKPTETLTEMSEIFNLKTGDLILTGTPGGVCLRLNSEIINHIYDNTISHQDKIDHFIETQQNNGYLKSGDIMLLEIKSTDGSIDLGVQENKIIQAAAVK
ncbi:fumarylacetoacetate hydrolase family protein [Pradoshia sp. D12]|uniref:fumarylacetoacetate hydrolase family protein n=1 Tax=Bacillaceae TaxID=186817 RepID=UPI001122F81B|nr:MULTISPECIES: fumarylacetoacetate hydrolase family protein [Bacillaceae]QFK71918.1 fumarylacetoacetate hydrolase family protein [Pradoshia sp. D12]TPF73712.1 fumarylacetoacetate hydrolase family protein [Bacillus sp. D12]